MSGSCPVGAQVCREAHVEAGRLRGERHNLTAEVVRLRTALDDLVDGWEDIGRGDIHPLVRGAILSAAGQVRDVLWPDDAHDE